MSILPVPRTPEAAAGSPPAAARMDVLGAIAAA
jgi:hypothetical protein